VDADVAEGAVEVVEVVAVVDGAATFFWLLEHAMDAAATRTPQTPTRITPLAMLGI
jgi:hypothetical protein